MKNEVINNKMQTRIRNKNAQTERQPQKHNTSSLIYWMGEDAKMCSHMDIYSGGSRNLR